MSCMCIVCHYVFFFFFKQKTAYELRISDWSSDVCSSDLATKAAIAADLDCWSGWCGEEGRSPLPADPEDLVRYVNALDGRGKKPATLARRIASLGTVHRMMGLAGEAAPTDAPMVRAALKAVRRRRGALPRQAAPLRLGKARSEEHTSE